MLRRSFLGSVVKAAVFLRSRRWIPSASSTFSTTAGKATGYGFVLDYSDHAVVSLRFLDDAFDTDYIEHGERLGEIELTWRQGTSEWQSFRSQNGQTEKEKPGVFLLKNGEVSALEVQILLKPERGVLRWSIRIRNVSAVPVKLGDLALPLPMHTAFSDKKPATASVLKHSFFSGAGSFAFWMRSNSAGPYLVMTPEAGTCFEYWDTEAGDDRKHFRAFVHSGAIEERIRSHGGSWRQPHTTLTLSPGSEVTYAVQFAWATDYRAVRRRLVEAGGLDIEIAGGMCVDAELPVTLAFHSLRPIESLQAEHAGDTTIQLLPKNNGSTRYRVFFRRFGENMLTVRQSGGACTRLEFFCSQPVETLLKKRAAFIRKHQVRDASKWYNGLFAEWNLESGVQLSPDNYDRIQGWRIYEVTCDDPGLSKPAFLASKNAEFPDSGEIEALDYYIEHFVWGGLQRTTEETDSFGIYGIPDWKHNRDSAKTGSDGKRHIWRPYDYPHIIVLYYCMYLIASRYPRIKMRKKQEDYLQRAYGTAIGMFTIPMNVLNWSAYETGFYNEAVLPDLIAELEAFGWHDKAAALRIHWEKKVAFFINGAPNLFGSEYAFDSTGFESTGVIARYAREHLFISGVTPAASASFALTQIRANLFCRGVIEKAYYYYGSDYRGSGGDSFTLTYMSPMGGVGVLDHALYDGREPEASLRLAYASLVSTWALMDAGTEATNFGYWFPGAANDGGTGGGFEPAAYGETWLGQPHHRGPWFYSSETDLGYCGALRGAATIVSEDAIFGLICLGGTIQIKEGEMRIIPRDGVRRRLYLRTVKNRMDITISGARFAAGTAVCVMENGVDCKFTLETELVASGTASISLRGLPAGGYRIKAGDAIHEFRSVVTASASLSLSPGSLTSVSLNRL